MKLNSSFLQRSIRYSQKLIRLPQDRLLPLSNSQNYKKLKYRKKWEGIKYLAKHNLNIKDHGKNFLWSQLITLLNASNTKLNKTINSILKIFLITEANSKEYRTNFDKGKCDFTPHSLNHFISILKKGIQNINFNKFLTHPNRFITTITKK